MKKVSKTKKKDKVTKSVKPKQPPVSNKDKPASKPSKPKSQAAGMFVKFMKKSQLLVVLVT